MVSKKSLILAPVLLAAGVTLASCSSGESAVAGDAGQSTTSTSGAQASIVQKVNAEAFQSQIAEPGSVIVDVRTPGEFAAGHIEGAVNLDVNGGDFAGGIADLDPSVKTAVYCRSGTRSAAAVAQMKDAGFKNLVELDGGIMAWDSANLPVVQ